MWNALTLSANLFLLFTIFISCTKELELEEYKTDGLCINSIINPDSVFSVNCSFISSLTDNYQAFNEKVYLRLFENNAVLIDTSFTGPEFKSSVYPNPMKSYRIELATAEYSVSACDSIPDFIQIDDAYLIFPAGLDAYGDYLGEANICFTDPKDQKNYYEVAIYTGTEVKDYWNWNGIDIEVTDPVILNEGIIDYFPSSLFFSDELFDGQSYTLKVKGYAGYYNPGHGFVCSSNTYVTLRSISEAYYNYRKYYTRHAYNQQFQGDFLDIIYKGEPQAMYSNIEMGFGIFAAYQSSTKQLYHKE